MSSLQPKTFAEAKASFKPMKRGTLSAKKKLAKKSKKKVSKDKVWKEFSIYIRTRGADSEGYVVCVTCGAQKYWKEMQAGHFIAGRLNSNLFDERGCQVQCYSCNVGKHGNGVMYYRWMATRYGEQVINELIAQNSQTHKWQAGELEQLLDLYRTLNASNPLVSAALDSHKE